MKIFKLFPINGEPETWKRSTFKGTLIVRAGNETSARELVQFEKPNFRALSIQEVTDSPWLNPKIIGCVEIKPGAYSVYGPNMVLEELC